MNVITSYTELQQFQASCAAEMEELHKGTQINVSLATCSIAAGARETYAALEDELQQQGLIDVTLRSSGCMCFCYAEPTVEIVRPGDAPLIFGGVDEKKSSPSGADLRQTRRSGRRDSAVTKPQADAYRHRQLRRNQP